MSHSIPNSISRLLALFTLTLAVACLEAAPRKELKAAEKSFLERNAQRSNVIQTKSGLQYEVLVKGNGTATPKARDRVSIHFKGTLTDGTSFENTSEREKPVAVKLSKAVPGFSEAIQLMSPGDTFRVYIPSKLAYGGSRMSDIPPYSVLIFEIELFEILGRR